MGNGSKSKTVLGGYGSIKGKNGSKLTKNAIFSELANKKVYQRRIENAGAAEKGIIFEDATAVWISDENGLNIGRVDESFLE